MKKSEISEISKKWKFWLPTDTLNGVEIHLPFSKVAFDFCLSVSLCVILCHTLKIIIIRRHLHWASPHLSFWEVHILIWIQTLHLRPTASKCEQVLKKISAATMSIKLDCPGNCSSDDFSLFKGVRFSSTDKSQGWRKSSSLARAE